MVAKMMKRASYLMSSLIRQKLSMTYITIVAVYFPAFAKWGMHGEYRSTDGYIAERAISLVGPNVVKNPNNRE
jgi:hypothetical protein